MDDDLDAAIETVIAIEAKTAALTVDLREARRIRNPLLRSEYEYLTEGDDADESTSTLRWLTNRAHIHAGEMITIIDPHGENTRDGTTLLGRITS
ncbi:MAG: hypothetical protein HN750_12225 [Gemmatimonadales bacterium]|jgi:hypothetical protein|nr:hypothetical protein [Gemmatimonadales bacterium]